MTKEIFNRFETIQHRPLRIYNRAVMFFNLYEDQGPEIAEDYANTFTAEERFEMAQMTALVKRVGPKRVKELVTSGLEFMDDPITEMEMAGGRR
jgi:hypothetical protein